MRKLGMPAYLAINLDPYLGVIDIAPFDWDGSSLHTLYVRYYSYSVPIQIVLPFEPRGRFLFIWVISTQKFELYTMKKVKIMPRKATATVPTVEKTPEKTPVPKHVGKGKGEKAAKAPKAAKAIVKPSSVVQDIDTILDQTYDRKFTPMPWSGIIENVCPEYSGIVKLAQQEQENAKDGDILIPRTVQIVPTAPFLLAWMRANGLNRARKATHVQSLATRFRSDFDPSCTHFVLTTEQAVANGGHSGPAIALAFFVADGRFDNSMEDPYSGKGYALESLIGSEDFEWILSPDVEQGYIDSMGDRFRLTLVLNAPHSAVLKMDDIRLSAFDSDFIEMLPCLVRTCEDWQIKSAQLAQFGNGLYKRTQEPTESTIDGKKITKYGTLSKGGRLNAYEAPTRVVTFLPRIQESLVLLRSYDLSNQKDITFFNGLSESLGLKDVIVAMAVSSEIGRKNIALGLCTQTEFGAELCRKLTKPANAVGWSKPNSDWIVTALVTYGMNPHVSAANIPDDAWHQPKYRAAGWDIGQSNSDDESRQSVIEYVAGKIAGLTGNDDIVTSTERKARRKREAAVRAAKK